MKKVLLDTSGYSGLLAGDEAILTAIAKADVVYMSIFVLRELHLGFKGGSQEQHNLKILDAFLAKPTCEVLNASEETVKIFGALKNSLKQAGTPLPINDVWIAAHTLESGSVLVSYDQHFEKMTGLHHWTFRGKGELDELL